MIPEIADETVSVIADPGEYVLSSGKKKGQTLNEVYADKTVSHGLILLRRTVC